MGTPAVISYFDTFEGDNEWAFLSNFYVGQPIIARPYTYLTGEHMFQAYKATSKEDHLRVVASPTPGEAKANGKHLLRLRLDWEMVKYDVMRLVLAYKFTLERDEGHRLLETGDALLVEGTTWGDRVWGVDLKEGVKAATRSHPHGVAALDEPAHAWAYAPGRNWLGALLMARRAELRAELFGVRFSYSQVALFARTLPPGRTR